MIVYLSKTNELMLVSDVKIPCDSTTITEIDIGNVNLLQEKEGYYISETWDSASEKLVQEYVAIEGYIPQETPITTEDIQAQLLLNTEYLVIISEIGM